MNVNVNRITNANVYIDGVNCLGMAESVKLPRVKAVMTEHKGLGMVGKGKFPAGIDALEGEIKWISFYPQVEALSGSIYATRQYQVRGSIETYAPQGIIAQVPGTWFMTALIHDNGEPMFKQHENVDVSIKMTVYHCEQWINNIPYFVYDLFSNTYIVDGVDQLAAYKQNIGGGGLGAVVSGAVSALLGQ